MDECSNSREVNGHPDSRRMSTHLSERAPRSMNQTAQQGCSDRRNVATSSQVICSENLNASKHSYKYAESRRVVRFGVSSLSSASTNSSNRRLWEPQRKPIPRIEKVLPEDAKSSGGRDGIIDHGLEVTGDIPLLEHHEGDCASRKEVVLNTAPSANVRTENNCTGKHVLTDLAGFGSSSTEFKASQSNVPRSSHSSNKYFSKSSKCNSSVDSRVHKRVGLLEKGIVEGESSSSRVKKTSPVKTGETSGSARGKSIETLRKHLHRGGLENNSASVSSRRSVISIREAKPSNQEYGNNSLVNESNVIIQGQDIKGHEVPVSVSASSMIDTNSSVNSMYHSITGGNSTSSSDLSVPSESVIQGGSSHHMDTVTEILLALENTGQVEQRSYQRLPFREMDSFLSSLSFHDQHRDLRLDIDNMSYEELLHLEDRIGCVSTAVTKDAMDKCLNKSFYKPTSSEAASIGYNKDEDDLKCSICQEEYVFGDEVGRLQCEHLYHMCCIQQWLNQKNWCPICKASAVHS